MNMLAVWDNESIRKRAVKPQDAWWTVLAVDPFAVPVLRLLVRWQWITPTGLTLLAGVLGIVPGLLFLQGHLIAGAAVFQLRFFIDCLDGKLARVRRQSSHRGALLDAGLDTVTLVWAWGTLASWVVARSNGSNALPLLLVAVVGLEAVARQRREQSHKPQLVPESPAGGGLRAWMAARRLVPLPSTVDLEAFGLFLAPILLARPGFLQTALWSCFAGYAVVTTFHWRRVYCDAAERDRHRLKPLVDGSNVEERTACV